MKVSLNTGKPTVIVGYSHVQLSSLVLMTSNEFTKEYNRRTALVNDVATVSSLGPFFANISTSTSESNAQFQTE